MRSYRSRFLVLTAAALAVGIAACSSSNSSNSSRQRWQLRQVTDPDWGLAFADR